MLLGGTTKGMAVAALVWNLVFLVALLRGASRLAPRPGRSWRRCCCAAFLEARGVGWLLSSWNPHVAMLPFGVALIACARLASGEARALPRAGARAQRGAAGSHGLGRRRSSSPVPGPRLCLWPAARARAGRPDPGRGLSRGAILARPAGGVRAVGAAASTTSSPASYQNLRRIVTMARDAYEPRPWREALGPFLRALELGRDGQAPGASFEWGARNAGFDPRLGNGDAPGDVLEGVEPRERSGRRRSSAWSLGVRLPGGRGAGAATAALALVAALAGRGAARGGPPVARSRAALVPAAWGAMVTLVALLVVGSRCWSASPSARPPRSRPGGPGAAAGAARACCSRAPSGRQRAPGRRRAIRDRSPSSG